ncbi:hypothetical protein [Streptomyces sp. ST1015]|uniref:hypothetical protein n=1 Tax=Streptomyces sp. ST1015 TaxID=1848900 RepID=UPI001CA76D40|nr:hypothetical protein [Streptomyces sp. ST1015]
MPSPAGPEEPAGRLHLEDDAGSAAPHRPTKTRPAASPSESGTPGSRASQRPTPAAWSQSRRRTARTNPRDRSTARAASRSSRPGASPGTARAASWETWWERRGQGSRSVQPVSGSPAAGQAPGSRARADSASPWWLHADTAEPAVGG